MKKNIVVAIILLSILIIILIFNGYSPTKREFQIEKEITRVDFKQLWENISAAYALEGENRIDGLKIIVSNEQIVDFRFEIISRQETNEYLVIHTNICLYCQQTHNLLIESKGIVAREWKHYDELINSSLFVEGLNTFTSQIDKLGYNDYVIFFDGKQANPQLDANYYDYTGHTIVPLYDSKSRTAHYITVLSVLLMKHNVQQLTA